MFHLSKRENCPNNRSHLTALRGVDSLLIGVLVFIFVVGWNINRFLGDFFRERKARIRLQRLRQTQGYDLLREFKKDPKQLSMLKEDNGNDAPNR